MRYNVPNELVVLLLVRLLLVCENPYTSHFSARPASQAVLDLEQHPFPVILKLESYDPLTDYHEDQKIAKHASSYFISIITTAHSHEMHNRRHTGDGW